jgi:hypothetical protein
MACAMMPIAVIATQLFGPTYIVQVLVAALTMCLGMLAGHSMTATSATIMQMVHWWLGGARMIPAADRTGPDSSEKS